MIKHLNLFMWFFRLNSELRRWIGVERPVYNNDSDKDSPVVNLRAVGKNSQLMLSQPSPPSIIPRQRRKIKLLVPFFQQILLMHVSTYTIMIFRSSNCRATYFIHLNVKLTVKPGKIVSPSICFDFIFSILCVNEVFNLTKAIKLAEA